MLSHEEKVKVRIMLGIDPEAPIPADVTAYFEQCVARFRQSNWVKPLSQETMTTLFIVGHLTGQFKAKVAPVAAKPAPDPNRSKPGEAPHRAVKAA